MTTRAFNVDLPGLLRVFGGHLYSSHGVFLRELVQNAVDAIVEQRRIDKTFGGKVRIRSDRAAGVVIVEDDGVGLDEERIEQCLARIAYSSKVEDDDLLGRFGIGLLAGFLVAVEIVVDTRREGGDPLRWRATPSGTYAIEKGDRLERGTTVRLRLSEEERRYGDRDAIRALCTEYLQFLPFVVEHEGERVSRDAPWLAADPTVAVREWLSGQPLAVFGIERGAMWIHADRGGDGGKIDVYLRGMLLERGTRKLLPRWASFATGVVDARRISPTASRETFVEDAESAKLGAEITTTLLDGLRRLPDTDPQAFERVLAVHYLQIRGACVDTPELLDAIGDRMPFETNVGRVDLRTLVSTLPEKILRYVDTPQDFAHTAPLANAQGISLVDASYTYDVPFLSAYARLRGLSLVRLSLDEIDMLIQPAPELSSRFAKVLVTAREALEPFGAAPELGRFEPNAMPAFLVADATGTAERARSLIRSSSSPLVLGLLAGTKRDSHTRFVLNVQNRLVAALPEVLDEDRVRRVVRLLHAQSSMTLRRSLSIAQTRAFSDDLLGLLEAQVRPSGDWN